ncbi:MAG TPA: universal stress protein [Frankiaceae bacterium]|jgi:nucleotide-binding universal stress UspA family protein|nr:universal stress protein [Frankiaceae bacterium]
MRIIVGVDGSAGAQRAFQWAIAEGRARGAAVTALLAYGYYGRPFDVQASTTGLDPAELDEAARTVLRQAVADLVPGPTAGQIDQRVSDSEPVDALLDDARPDDLLVVGARGLGPVRRLLLGSVSLHCTRHAACPTVIVRESSAPDIGIAAGPVVVGIDGSPQSLAALHWAAEHARCRAVPLHVIHVWPIAETQPAEVDDLFEVTAQRDRHRREIEALVDRAVDPRQRPDVTVHFLDGSPVAVLLEAAEDASLLVVGSRGQGGIARLLLGSTSAACLLHAPSNVAVVPQPNGLS